MSDSTERQDNEIFFDLANEELNNNPIIIGEVELNSKELAKYLGYSFFPEVYDHYISLFQLYRLNLKASKSPYRFKVSSSKNNSVSLETLRKQVSKDVSKMLKARNLKLLSIEEDKGPLEDIIFEYMLEKNGVVEKNIWVEKLYGDKPKDDDDSILEKMLFKLYSYQIVKTIELTTESKRNKKKTISDEAKAFLLENKFKITREVIKIHNKCSEKMIEIKVEEIEKTEKFEDESDFEHSEWMEKRKESINKSMAYFCNLENRFEGFELTPLLKKLETYYDQVNTHIVKGNLKLYRGRFVMDSVEF